MEINQETRYSIRKMGEKIVKAFVEIVNRIWEWVQENWQWLKEAAVKWYQLEEKKKVVVRQPYKRDFSRQKISHQVINRKPQHLVRKIIRR